MTTTPTARFGIGSRSKSEFSYIKQDKPQIRLCETSRQVMRNLISRLCDTTCEVTHNLNTRLGTKKPVKPCGVTGETSNNQNTMGQSISVPWSVSLLSGSVSGFSSSFCGKLSLL